jgi:CheY-like chemotaxis protein
MARILVVDDDPDFVRAARIVLEREGYTVDSAADGDEALARIAECRPDLIILDVMMATVLDGVSVAQLLGENPQTRGIPIIMSTAIPTTEYAEMFPTDQYVHLDVFLTKPVPPERLLKEVKRLLQG